MRSTNRWLLLLLVVAPFVFGQQNPPKGADTPPKATETAPKAAATPPEAAKVVNPVKPTPESIDKGKKLYSYDCAMCHGDNGEGKGEVAVDEKYDLKDLRDPATLKDRTDGELFQIIKSGKPHMPPEGTRLSNNDLWNVVNYVRSLSKKTDAK